MPSANNSDYLASNVSGLNARIAKILEGIRAPMTQMDYTEVKNIIFVNREMIKGQTFDAEGAKLMDLLKDTKR